MKAWLPTHIVNFQQVSLLDAWIAWISVVITFDVVAPVTTSWKVLYLEGSYKFVIFLLYIHMAYGLIPRTGEDVIA